MNRKRVGVVSLGCSKNLVDTEEMLGYLTACGFEITNDPSCADILIVNTCGFIDSAKEESINTILELAEYKESGTCKVLAVTGCLSQRYGEEMKGELPEVDIFWGVKNYVNFAEELAKRFGLNGDCRNADRILTTPKYSAYLRISDGCRNRCTYCAIPNIRGEMVSIPKEKLLCEAKRLAGIGVSEINVIAQDTSAYGIDIYGKTVLPELLREIAEIDGIESIRLLYTYPDTVTDELIETIAGTDKIANYIDIPIQHINDEILQAMNRRGTKKDITRIFNKIRATADDFIIRTSIITGFPGETQEQFDELLSFLRENPVDRLGAFTYSPEDGTKAVDFDGQIDDNVKQQRLDRLMKEQKEHSRKLNEKRVGSVTKILVEKVEGDCLYGRSYGEAPDVDGVILVKNTKKYDVGIGDYINVKLTAAHDYDLEGETI